MRKNSVLRCQTAANSVCMSLAFPATRYLTFTGMFVISWSLLASSLVYGQGQISPNPNPSGNTISLNNGSLWFNSLNFVNDGTIENSDTLDNQVGGILTNNGTIENALSGTINNYGTLEFSSGSVLNNAGLINNESGGIVISHVDDLFFNIGDFDQKSGSEFQNHATMTNTGSNLNFMVYSGTTFSNFGTFGSSQSMNFEGTFNNSGDLTSTASISVTGSLNNSVGGTINNQATLTFAAGSSFTNDGVLNNQAGGFIESYVDDLYFTGTINHSSGSNFQNYASMTNVAGNTMTHVAGAQFVNLGNFTNDGTVVSNGELFNYAGSITNNGSFTNNDLWENETAFHNYGTLIYGSGSNFMSTPASGEIHSYNGSVIESYRDDLYFNMGDYYQYDGSEFQNHATMTNTGSNLDIQNYANLIFSNFGTLNNDSTLNNEGTLNNDGLIVNTNLIDNHNTFNNLAGGTINNQHRMVFESGSTFNNSGVLNNQNGGSIESYVDDLYFAGAINHASGSNFQNYATMTNVGSNTMTNVAGAQFSNGGNFTNDGTMINNGELYAFAGSITNNGSFTNNDLWDNETAFHNNGTLIFGSGSNFSSLEAAGEIHNYNGGVIQSYRDDLLFNLGDFYEYAGSEFQNFATITDVDELGFFNYADTTFSNFGTFNGTIFNEGIVNNNGTFNDQGSENQGTFNNEATFNIDASGVFNNHSSFINNGTINVDGFLVNEAGGVLMGDGLINGQLEDYGTLAAGNSAGVMTIDGNLFKFAGSTEIEIGGDFDGGGDKSLTEFDWLDISGDVDLSGTLNVEFIDGFQMAGFMSFEILNIDGTLTGQFDGLAEGGLVGNFAGTELFITYIGGDGNDIVLFGTAIPEPSTLLLGLGIGLVAFCRRRRTR